jgi:hypothetical protein
MAEVNTRARYAKRVLAWGDLFLLPLVVTSDGFVPNRRGVLAV